MKKYKTTCAIILNAKKEFLLIKRAREPFKGAWALVSGIGGIKKGLSPEEAVRDEVYYDLQTLFEGRFIFSLPVESDQNTDEVVVFKGTIDEVDIDPNPETVDVFGWFAKKDIKKLGPLAFEHEKILDKI